MARYVFSDSSIKESDLHPNPVIIKEQQLAKEFVLGMEGGTNIDSCPISNQKRSEILFEKWGQRFALCPETWSLSMANLPMKEVVQEYFYSSKLSSLRSSTEFQEQVSKNRNTLWKNQIDWIEGRINRYLGDGHYVLLDYGCKHLGWESVLKGSFLIKQLFKEQSLLPIIDEEATASVDVVTVFDFIQRTIEPVKYIEEIFKKLKPGGLAIFSCRSGSGFDILTLREESKTIYPLDHICLPSPAGMQLMLDKAGFKVLELATPGLLDVQLVKSAADKIPDDQYFQRYLINCCDEFGLERLQQFLQQNNLSSHMRVVARKPLD